MIASAIVLLLVLIFFGAQIYLFVNFVLGNDTVVKLGVDKEVLSLVHGQEEKVTFKASVTTNIFCTAVCTSEFFDISRDREIEQETFTLRAGNSHEKEYALRASRPGSGIELYRINMECRSKKSIFCHTSEEPTTRSILLTVQYDLNDEEKKLKKDAIERSTLIAEKIGQMRGRYDALKSRLYELNKSVVVDEIAEDMGVLRRNIQTSEKDLEQMEALWEGQDYPPIGEQLQKMDVDFAAAERQFQRINESVAAYLSSTNGIVGKLGLMRDELLELQSIELSNFTRLLEINESISSFALLQNDLQTKTTIGQKQSAVDAVAKDIQQATAAVRNEIKNEVLRREIELDVVSDVLCEVSGVCVDHPTTEARARQTNFELNTTCARVERVRKRLIAANASMQAAFSAQNYPMNDEFLNNITQKIQNVKIETELDYNRSLPANGTNTPILMELLPGGSLVQTEEYTQHNLTPALVHELVKQKPIRCVLYNASREQVAPVSLQPIVIGESVPVQITFALSNPLPQCCVFGECRACCESEECKNDPDTYPVMFLHGHAVNKDISAEYSLEGFNKIQRKLEGDGYLSAGAITLYTERDTPYGIWGRMHTPMTLRASYYFDIFKEPENYVVVQTKSENIDTYAIRLKELVDTVKHKTGKPKVKIIAFSMGGLVARRYLQIFGSDSVHTLVLIGTPNKGIVGDIADYCPVTGEKLECRDMNAQSLFMNKLNQGKLPDIPVHNIVGTGCVMDGGVGDGAVFEERGILEGAQNHVIKGKCRSSVYPLHLDLQDIDMYPEVYTIIKDALEFKEEKEKR